MSLQQLLDDGNRKHAEYIANRTKFAREAEVEIGWVSIEEAENQNPLVLEPEAEPKEPELVEEPELEEEPELVEEPELEEEPEAADEETEKSDVEIPTRGRQRGTVRQQRILEELVVEWVRSQFRNQRREAMHGSSAPGDVGIVPDEDSVHEEGDGERLFKAEKEFCRSLGD